MSAPENDDMTSAQREAICRAYGILTEHFERVVLVVDYDVDPARSGGENMDGHEGYWYGGSMAAIGLCEFAKDRILNSGKKYIDPSE